jgi:hypothetical protein
MGRHGKGGVPKMFRWLRQQFSKLRKRYPYPSLETRYYSDIWFKPIKGLQTSDVSYFWVQLGACALSWALHLLPDERALALQRLAIQYFKKAGPSYHEEARELLMIYLSTIVKQHNFFDKALKEIKAEDPDWADLHTPFFIGFFRV